MNHVIALSRRFHPVLVLLAVSILSYGLLLPQLGFYWDDLPISWIRYQLGPEALAEYFSTNRPVWGLLYQITTRIFPQVPVFWQLFALLTRWLGAVMVWAIVHRLWKHKPAFALSVALLFLVYPGFNQHWASFLYSHFFVVLFLFLASFWSMLVAIEQPARYWRWTSLGLALSSLNLWMMEYFFILELARVGVIWMALRRESLPGRERVRAVLGHWLPYLALFILAVLSRVFIFNNQVYGISLTEQVQSAPIETLRRLLESTLLGLRLTLKDAWLQAFQVSDLVGTAQPAYFLVVAAAIGFAMLGLIRLSRDRALPYQERVKDSVYALGLGGLAVLLAGWPFWLIGFEPSLAWPASRFTLPFMFGSSLILAALVALVPWRAIRTILLVLLVGLSAGRQFLWAEAHGRDWETQRSLFWQLTWRAPAIEPDTLLLLNEGALDYYADNSLSSALNWIYAPDNHSPHVEYALFYPTTRLRNALPRLEPGIPIHFDYLAGEFNGNTSRTLAVYFEPPGCLRVLDPEIEGRNRLIRETSLMRFAARISSPDLILREPRAQMPAVYGSEPAHAWCYYFQKADLARQYGDWAEVVRLGEIAFSLEDPPRDPAEWLVFVEGYAHAGDWARAFELSAASFAASHDNMEAGRLLCRLWERIQTRTPESAARSEILPAVRSMFGCNQ